MRRSKTTARVKKSYGEPLAELRRGLPQTVARPYRVTLLGRWSQLDAPSPASDRGSPRAQNAQTPIVAQPFAIEIEDAGGIRHVELRSVTQGRRYSVGKGEDCDIVVDGLYTSRRHCEIWFDKGGWWVADAGSTNGIRVESASGVIARGHQGAHGAARLPAIELPTGAWLVLSEHTQGEPRQYPRLSLHPAVDVEAGVKPASEASPP